MAHQALLQPSLRPAALSAAGLGRPGRQAACGGWRAPVPGLFQRHPHPLRPRIATPLAPPPSLQDSCAPARRGMRRRALPAPAPLPGGKCGLFSSASLINHRHGSCLCNAQIHAETQ